MVKKNPAQQSWLRRYLSGLNFGGVVIGALLVYPGLSPSLLPRSWVLQGLLSGILFCIGYGLGVLVSHIIRQFPVREFSPAKKSVIKRYVVELLLGVYGVMIVLGALWQKEVLRLVQEPSVNNFLLFVSLLLGSTLMAIVIILFLLMLSRSIRTLFRWLKKQTLRLIPASLATIIALVVTTLLVIGLVNGVIWDKTLDVLNNSFSVRNDSTDPGITQPTSPQLSGSPESYIPWDTLGRQGRKFIGKVQSTQKIGEFNNAPARQPVRIYAGLQSAESTTDRANLAVKDLKRAGGFDRKVLVVVSTTGTGWVDENGVDPVEWMYDGDSAIVSMQYSYLPSWLSFLVDRTKAQEAGIDLYNAVLNEWIQLPVDKRPKLVVFGESLGSYGSASAFTGQAAFKATSNGAVWAGPPNFNALWRKATDSRESGTPEIQPIVQNGQTVRFASRPDNFLDPSLQSWGSPKASYLQNPSDPIVWWSPHLLFNKPDWLKEPRGADVSVATRWFPFVTFWQVTGDMIFSTAAPDGHGHKYGNLPTDAWGYVAPPAGWTSQKTADLKEAMAQ